METHTQLLDRVDRVIRLKHLLNHDFYLAWSRGELSRECLQEYAKDYYHHVKAFPMYLSALHSHVDEANTRRVLLQNLVEEEAGTPNHPDLWKKFVLALGVTEQELEDHKPSVEMQQMVSSFRETCSCRSTAEGIAALYTYESQIPAVCISKIEGLKKYYGMTNPKEWEYFTVHITADEEHSRQERELLEHYTHAGNKVDVENTVCRTVDALWNFLTNLCDRYQVACSMV